ncbi:MAG: hypothetical protein R3261_12180, partial [Alphaproteobacteria bacterium]|nr:hypothetical protein [Alphaproteobacteria bacterium]
GEDLLHATHIHRILQALLGFPEPQYLHHPLLTGPDGKRFAKRDKSKTLQSIRIEGDNDGGIAYIQRQADSFLQSIHGKMRRSS